MDVSKLDAAEKALTALPFITGDITFKATPNGSARSTTGKEAKYSVNEQGFKVIEVSMGSANDEFSTKVGNFTITEEQDYYRVITDKEYYASKTQTWRVSKASVDVSLKGTVKFTGINGPYLSIVSDELYELFRK